MSAPLVTALGAGFLWFNQALFWMLAVLLVRGEHAATAAGAAGRLGWVSLGAGAAVLGALGYLQAATGARRAMDLAVWLGAAVLLGCGMVNASPAVAVAGNAAAAAWALRGLGRTRGGRG